MGLIFTTAARKKLMSARDALAAVSHAHWREIARGRAVANLLAVTHGTVNAREMVEYMIAEGSLIPGQFAEHWVSVVFRSSEWEWTGEWTARRKSQNTQGGERPIKVWRRAK